jgi:hypothetical protein
MVSRRFPQHMKRLLPLTVAAALLLVPGPAAAAGLDRDGGWRLADPGAFFAQVWEAFLDVLPMGGGSIDPNGGGDNDGGGSIDPNGLTVGDGGGSIDPNGRD